MKPDLLPGAWVSHPIYGVCQLDAILNLNFPALTHQCAYLWDKDGNRVVCPLEELSLWKPRGVLLRRKKA